MRSLLLMAVLGGFLFSQTAGTEDDSIRDNVDMTSDDAKDFNTPLSRARRGLYHECYDEGCSFEEVEEVLGRNQHAYEYYYTYTCHKHRQNCKVRCNYRRDCSFGSWGQWAGASSDSECFNQKRSKPYRHPRQQLLKRHNCNGLHTSCPSAPSENRMYCICKKAVCRAGAWSAWGGSVPQGKCVTQSRQMPFHVTWTTENQLSSCAGVTKRCNAPSVDLRRMCSCPRAVCTLNNWSDWQGSVAQGSCGNQRRIRSYSKTTSYVLHSDCGAVKSSCPAIQTATRKFCSCKYATCQLGEWSEWEPKQLDQGSCGQAQSRKKSYALTWAYQAHAGDCPSLPQKCPDAVTEKRQQCVCSYRDSCDMNEWTAWDNEVTAEGCKVQTRRRTYVDPIKHMQKNGCDGLNTQCIVEPTQTRTYCKCKSVKCSSGDWTDWSQPTIETGSCEEQTRTKPSTSTVVYTNQQNNCDGVKTTCPASETGSRRMCKCSTVKCEVGEWSAWQGKISADTCATQTRSKDTKVINEHKYKENTCEGLTTTCPDGPQESQNMCNCSYREDCTLKEWQAWSGDIPDAGCSRQIRTREYNNSIIYVQRASCEGLTGCSVLRDEVRVKCNCNQINCDWTNWFRESFDAENSCYTETRVKNITSGFKKIQQMENCDGIPTMCDEKDVERRKDCQSGGGGHVIVTSPTPKPIVTTIAPTTAFVPATFVHIGCFKDNQGDRTMPHVYLNMRSEVTDWYDFSKIIQGCANAAREARYDYFGVQFFGECWGGKDQAGNDAYARDGPAESKNCYIGVGMQSTNEVYRIENMPACSSELEVSSRVSSGSVDNAVWCAGSADKFQWITVEMKNAMKISGVGTQGGTKDSWVTLYTVEYSEEGESWVPYKESKEPKTFAGNSDQFTLETYWLTNPINARFLRFKPLSWTSVNICMKVRVYGCSV